MTEIKIDRKERFIPIGRQEIVKDLLASSDWNNNERQNFNEFCNIFIALYHFPSNNGNF